MWLLLHFLLGFSIQRISQSSLLESKWANSFYLFVHSFLQLILFRPKVVRAVWLRFPSLSPHHFPRRRELPACWSFSHFCPSWAMCQINASMSLSMGGTLLLLLEPFALLLSSIILALQLAFVRAISKVTSSGSHFGLEMTSLLFTP